MQHPVINNNGEKKKAGGGGGWGSFVGKSLERAG